MPASAAVCASVLPSVWDLLDTPSPVCPGCKVRFPRWEWVRFDGLRVLTHDGDVICPCDTRFGYDPVVGARVASPVKDACPDCRGTGTTSDTDGSVSGVVGAEIPCACSDSAPASVALAVAA